MRSKVIRGQLVFCKNEFKRYCNCPSSVNFVDSFPPRGSQEIRRKYSLPPRGKAFLMQSFQGSEIVSSVQATVRYETGEACKAVGKFQTVSNSPLFSAGGACQAKPAALNMPPESRGRSEARAPCLRARRCPFPARTPATRRKALFSRSVPPAARWCPVR